MTQNWIDPNASRRPFAKRALGAVALTLGMTLAGGAQAVDLRFGHGGTEDTAYQLGAERFKELVEDKTDGDVSVTILGNSVLGHETEMFEQQMAGALDMVSGTRFSTAAWHACHVLLADRPLSPDARKPALSRLRPAVSTPQARGLHKAQRPRLPGHGAFPTRRSG